MKEKNRDKSIANLEQFQELHLSGKLCITPEMCMNAIADITFQTNQGNSKVELPP